MSRVAVIGDDGTRPVVWGLGEDAESALADAQQWTDPGALANVAYVDVTPEQADRILAGAVDCVALNIRVTYDRGGSIHAEVAS